MPVVVSTRRPPSWEPVPTPTSLRFPSRSCGIIGPDKALESKCKSGEKRVDTLQKEKRRLEAELEAVFRRPTMPRASWSSSARSCSGRSGESAMGSVVTPAGPAPHCT
ncbi:hypothetical protein MC885_013570 [Smutsia gigantea]|nr:hypothetical protein MC885_013570 [Smutsia gigantea]